MKWVIYYGDGSTYSDEDGDPYNAPPNNVQVVVDGGKIRFGKDAFYWHPDIGWCATDNAGFWDHMLMYIGPKAVIFGRNIRNEDFWEIKARAKKEWEENDNN